MAVAIRFFRFWAGWALFMLWFGMHSALGAERGLLWKIESTGAPISYLFGTIHTDDVRVTDFSPELKQAMRQSKHFMMEVLPPANFSVFFMKQGTLRDLLTEQEIDQVLKLADQHVIQERVALRMKPWLLASVLTLPRAQSFFYQDIQLYAMANNSGMKLLGLEEADEHFSALDEMSLENQLTLLRAVLALPQEEKEQAFEAVVQAYVNRDVEQILAADESWSNMMLSDELWNEVETLLLDRRNERMAQGIAEQIAVAPAFIAVGAAHLAGTGGLIARLRKAGFTLSPIQ